MKALVAFASRQGCSEKSAHRIRQVLEGECDLLDLDAEGGVDLSPYDMVVIGGPVYYGRMRASVRQFCQTHLQVLLARRVGLYICCMESGAAAREELRRAFPAQLLEHAAACGIFGGELHPERLPFVERFVVRAMVRSACSIKSYTEERVDRFVRDLLAG